ncbi:MAG: Hpt domain-containing protein, partial [Cyanobacteria bacterium J06597_16]
MLPEQQQRIMGYFIEEAKDHLNTIEQGLLNLQSTIEDADKANEVFRAAHSVKGGAAMLGIESIQKTAHRMEDYFKVLKEAPVQVDRTLETMFLRVSDGLKDLLEQLEGPFGLTPEKAQEIMADVEPVFTQLESHLNSLVEATGRSSMLAASVGGGSSEDLKVSFKRDVASLLRQMLTTFKQADTPDARKKIQEMCAQLIAVGEQFDLPEWCDLIETARIASANLDNDFRALAPVLIKEIKKAQDLVLSGRSSEVSVCEDLQALLPEDILEPNSDALNLDGLNGDLNDDLSSALGGELDDFPVDESDLDLASGLASDASEDSLE